MWLSVIGRSFKGEPSDGMMLFKGMCGTLWLDAALKVMGWCYLRESGGQDNITSEQRINAYLDGCFGEKYFIW